MRVRSTFYVDARVYVAEWSWDAKGAESDDTIDDACVSVYMVVHSMFREYELFVGRVFVDVIKADVAHVLLRALEALLRRAKKKNVSPPTRTGRAGDRL